MGDLRPGDWVRVDDHHSPAWVGRVAILRSQWVTVRAQDGREERARWRHITPAERPAVHPGAATQQANHELHPGEPQPKALPLRDKPYLEWVRERPCFFCGVQGRTQASHHGRGGTATKAGDDTVLPACDACHNRHHGKDYSPHPMLDGLTADGRRRALRAMAEDVRGQYEREVLHG